MLNFGQNKSNRPRYISGRKSGKIIMSANNFINQFRMGFHNQNFYNQSYGFQSPNNFATMPKEVLNKIVHSMKEDHKEADPYSIISQSMPYEAEDILNTSSSSSNIKLATSNQTKFKTEICKYWELDRTCKFKENCAFAHGAGEIRQKVIPSSNYKTKKCKQFFENGYCSYGQRCQFLHHVPESSGTVYSFSYKKIIEDILDPSNQSFEIKSRPRLRTFEKLVKSGNDKNQDSLVKDIAKMKLKGDF